MIIDFGTLFQNATVAGVPLLLFVIALVQEIKADFNLEGRIVKIVALGSGLLIGLGYQLSLAIPVGFSGWFTAVIFAVLLGLGASRLYDAAETVLRASRSPEG